MVFWRFIKLRTSITFTNIKECIGKNTDAGLLALYFLEHRFNPVALLDVDPYCGSTSWFIKKYFNGLTVNYGLVATSEGDDTFRQMRAALVYVPSKSTLSVIPVDKHLPDIITGIPADILLQSIRSTQFSDETIMIIYNDTPQDLVDMGICATDKVHITLITSKQTEKPTLNSLFQISYQQRLGNNPF